MSEPTTQQPTELDMLRMKMNVKTDQSEETGAATLQNLHAQGDQLRQIDGNLDDIHADLTEAQRNLDKMDKCCGLCILPWKKSKPSSAYNYPKSQAMNASSKNVPMGYQKNGNYAESCPPTDFQKGQYIQRITNDAREDEMESNLHQVSNIVSNLHNMASGMGQELASHNQLIDTISHKTKLNQSQLNDAQKKADQILGEPSASNSGGESLMPSDPRLTAAKMMLK